jgi:quinol monooxygenase YgiN
MSTSETINVVAIFHPVAGHRDQVLAALHTAIPLVHDEPGCEFYAITEADDGRLVMIEKWTSAALLDVHGTSPAVIALIAALDGHLSQPVEVIRLMPLPMGDDDKGAL